MRFHQHHLPLPSESGDKSTDGSTALLTEVVSVLSEWGSAIRSSRGLPSCQASAVEMTAMPYE